MDSVTCSSATKHRGIIAHCIRSPHQPHEFHSACETVDDVTYFITWRDCSLTFIRAMEEIEADPTLKGELHT